MGFDPETRDRLRVRLGHRSPGDAALRHRRPAPLLRRRPALPAPVRLSRRRHAIPRILAARVLRSADRHRRARRAADHGRPRGRVAAPRRAAVPRRRRRPVLSVEPHPERRSPARLPGRRRRGRAARHRLRRAERACRHQGAVRARRRGAAAGEGGQRRAVSHQGRQDPRRREPRHAVLGARAQALRRPRRPARSSTTTRRSAPTCASSSSSTTPSSRSSSRPTSATA